MFKSYLLLLFLLAAVVISNAQNDANGKIVRFNDLDLINVEGKPFYKEELKGKFVFIDFWGQGCKPCVENIPKLIELQNKYSKKLIILAINDRIRLSNLPKFLAEHSINHRVVIPRTDEELMPVYYIFSKGKFEGFPYYTLVDAAGRIVLANTWPDKVERYLNR